MNKPITKLIKTKYGYYRFDPIPDVDYSAYYSDVKPDYIKNMEEDIEWWNMIYDDRLREFKKGSIFDVGCGAGFFVKRANEKGWTAWGVDCNKDAIYYAQSISDKLDIPIKCYPGHFEIIANDKRNTNFFSNIHCSYLLEHLPDPEGMLKECYRVLRKDGIICVVVPNDFNPLQMLLKPKYGEYWIEYPWHINYFNFDSLQALMEDVGFKIEKVITGFPMEVFALIKPPPTMTGNKELARLAQKIRMAIDIEMTWQQRDEIYTNLASFKIGREVIIYGTK